MKKNDVLVRISLWLAQELETDSEELAALYVGYEAEKLYRKQAQLLREAMKEVTNNETKRGNIND